MTDGQDLGLDRPSGARIYDYMIGGKDNFDVDRKVADAMLAVAPSVGVSARANRDFLQRAVRYLVAEAGVRQFLDIGSGIPTMSNVHQVAQDIDPDCRVVYVDNDPIVAAHSRALLVRDERTAFVTADATNPAGILAAEELTRTLDLSRPVALMFVSFLMYFDDLVAANIVSALRNALPPGSYVVISHPTADLAADEDELKSLQAAGAAATAGGVTYVPRTRDQVADLLAGTTLVPPGLVPMQQWRRPAAVRPGVRVHYWVGVGRTP